MEWASVQGTVRMPKTGRLWSGWKGLRFRNAEATQEGLEARRLAHGAFADRKGSEKHANFFEFLGKFHEKVRNKLTIGTESREIHAGGALSLREFE